MAHFNFILQVHVTSVAKISEYVLTVFPTGIVEQGYFVFSMLLQCLWILLIIMLCSLSIMTEMTRRCYKYLLDAKALDALFWWAAVM